MADTETLKKLYIALKEAKEKIVSLETIYREPIAIIGMACRFPGGANNPDLYWDILKTGTDTITEVPSDRWDKVAHYDPNPDIPGKMHTIQGGFINQPVDSFDAAFFNISPKETKSLDPQQRLLLEVSWEAFENSGIDVSTLLGSQTGVFIGISNDDYVLAHRHSGVFDKINAYSLSGTAFSTASGRISYTYGLEGPNMPIETACSSSLVALHLACQSLRLKESNLALAGGVNLILAPEQQISFSKLQAISPEGRCKSFDAAANGYGRGEGCGFLVLKRLTDAINEGDSILAVVKGTAVNQDGKSSGLTVPNGLAQQKVIRQALNNAGLSFQDIEYIEAHGTGTALGDPIEVEAIGQILKEVYPPDQTLLIGSVKTNIGHLESAAGISGLIKVILSLIHEEIPPNLHFNHPNPQIPWDELPIKVLTELTPWPHSERPRRAGVNGFGFGGSNAHAILEEAPLISHQPSETERPTHVLALSAKHENALIELANRYIGYLSSEPAIDIADICYTASVGRCYFEHRLAIIGQSNEELKNKLSQYINNNIDDGVYKQQNIDPINPSKIAFLFTGQGSQYIGMGQQLYKTQPTFRKTLDRCDEILRDYLDETLLGVLYPPCDDALLRGKHSQSEVGNEKLNNTAYTQPVLFALEYALAKLWQSWGIEPSIVMGHSVGEYVAACIAGVFSLEDGLKLITERARLMQNLPKNGEMISALADEKQVRLAIQPYVQKVSIAAINGPQSIVFSGESQAVQAVATILHSQGIKTKKLQVSHAFHSPLMEPMLADFEKVAQQITYFSPQIDIISNVTGELITEKIKSPAYWCRHVRQTVKFAKSMETLYQQDYRVFIETGPKPNLLGMGRQCLAEEEKCLWLPSLRPKQEDWQQILQTLSTLYVQGCPINWANFERDYSRCKVVLPTYPFQRQSYWMSLNSAANKKLAPSETALHPLLDRKLQTPLLKETLFESWFSSDSLPFLEDHRIFGKLVVSGATYVSLLLGACELTFDNGWILEDILFPQALAIPDNDGRTVQLMLTPENDTKTSFKLISFDQTNESITHASGQILITANLNSKPLLATLDFQKLRTQCRQEISATSLYQAQQARQIILGPSYQWLQSIYKGDKKAIGTIKLPAVLMTGHNIEKYQLHPGLIDSCFGLLVSTMDIRAEDTFIPFSIEKVCFYQRPSNHQFYAYATLREVASNKLIGDIQLFDEDHLIAEFIGLEGRQASREILLRSLQKDYSDWLYEISWQPKETDCLQPTKQMPNSWLIFSNQSDNIGDHLITLLQKQGDRCVRVSPGSTYECLTENNYRIDPTAPSNFERLLQETMTENQPHCYGVVYLWSLATQTTEEITLTLLQNAQILNCGGVLYLVQALIKTAWSDLPGLWLVTSGAQMISSFEHIPLQVQQAPVWGLGRTITLEHPEFRCVSVDLEPHDMQSQMPNSTDNAQNLFKTLWYMDKEDRISYRQGIRYVARLTQHSAKFPTSSLSVIHKKGCYLITGGLGALGRKVAAWLVAQGATHLVLIGRSEPSEHIQKEIQQWQQTNVKVRVIQADIVNAKEVASLLETLKTTMPPLRGIIHAAGVLDDGVLRQQSWERFKQALAPKIEGSWNLHLLTRDIPLDFFVCFSSITSLFGSPAQGNYAAANAFMDALVHYRHALKLPALSVNWGPWEESGMAADLRHRDKQRLVEKGLGDIPSEVGLQLLGQLLVQNVTQIGILSIDWSKFLHQFFQTIPPFLDSFTQTKRLVDAPVQQQWLKQLEEAPQKDRRTLLMAQIRTQIAKVLELDSIEHIQPRQSLFELGIDSLMAVDLQKSLVSNLGCTLRSTVIFDYPTVEKLTDYLIQDMLQLGVSQSQVTSEQEEKAQNSTLAEVEQLSEEEAEALLLAEMEKMALN